MRLLWEEAGKAAPPEKQRQPAQCSLPGAQTLPPGTHGSPAPREGWITLITLPGQCWEEGLALSSQKQCGHLLPPLHSTCWDTGRWLRSPPFTSPQCPHPTPQPAALGSLFSIFPSSSTLQSHHPHGSAGSVPRAGPPQVSLTRTVPRFTAGFALLCAHTAPRAMPSPGDT